MDDLQYLDDMFREIHEKARLLSMQSGSRISAADGIRALVEIQNMAWHATAAIKRMQEQQRAKSWWQFWK
jgi:hypothetical protein